MLVDSLQSHSKLKENETHIGPNNDLTHGSQSMASCGQDHMRTCLKGKSLHTYPRRTEAETLG